MQSMNSMVVWQVHTPLNSQEHGSCKVEFSTGAGCLAGKVEFSTGAGCWAGSSTRPDAVIVSLTGSTDCTAVVEAAPGNKCSTAAVFTLFCARRRRAVIFPRGVEAEAGFGSDAF